MQGRVASNVCQGAGEAEELEAVVAIEVTFWRREGGKVSEGVNQAGRGLRRGGEEPTMSSPSTTTKWMSYFAEGLLAEEEVQPSNPFFWCTNQQPTAEQVDCRYLCKRSPPCTSLPFLFFLPCLLLKAHQWCISVKACHYFWAFSRAQTRRLFFLNNDGDCYSAILYSSSPRVRKLLQRYPALREGTFKKKTLLRSST